MFCFFLAVPNFFLRNVFWKNETLMPSMLFKNNFLTLNAKNFYFIFERLKCNTEKRSGIQAGGC